MTTETKNAVVLNDAGFVALEQEVNKKEGGKYVPVGKYVAYIPTLEAAGITAERGDDEEGLPSYKDDKLQWIFNSMVAAVKAKARNALQPGTAELKPGNTIAADWEALLAEGVRGGGAEALAIVRDLRKAFAEHVASLGKSAKAQALLNSLFGNRNALALQTAENREKMAGYISAFVESMDAELAEKGQRYLQSLLDACEAESEAEDF